MPGVARRPVGILHGAFVATLLLCGAAPPVRAQGIALADTPAGQAFKARQYDVALVEFQKLTAENPRDALVLRFLATTLDRLGRYQEAIAAFRRALTLQPDNAATHFHLGTTYYKSGAVDLADDSFRRVLKIAADSLYAQLAQRYLEAIAQQRSQLQPSGAPAPVTFSAEAGVQYDSNIPAAPSDRALFEGKHGGFRIFEYLTGEYRFLRVPGWLGSLEGSTYQAQYPESAFEKFDVSTYSAGASLQRDLKLGTLPATLSLKYGFNLVQLDWDTYSHSHIVTAASQLGVTRETVAQLYYRYTRDDFADEGFDPAISSRDADNHAVGVAGLWYFAERKGHVGLGYEYQRNNARGLNFEFEGHKVSLSAAFPLFWEIRGTLGAEYGHEFYGRFQGPARRKTDRWGVTAGLLRWIGRRVFTKLTFAFTDEGSNYDDLAYDRWLIGASLGYVY